MMNPWKGKMDEEISGPLPETLQPFGFFLQKSPKKPGERAILRIFPKKTGELSGRGPEISGFSAGVLIENVTAHKNPSRPCNTCVASP